MRSFRVVAVAVAAVMCAGFAIGVRQARGSSEVTALLATGHGLTPSQQRSAASDLSSAALGYPGQDVRILAASVALRERRFAYAMSIARSINRAEPDNLQGWVVLAAAGILTGDRRAEVHAKRELIRLDPIDARSR
jgi:formate-dependent phosphoribosylglycinamide formyltransferase (GAR transformylase)